MIDPVYFTDDYPREGCSVVFEVRGSSSSMTVRAPNGKPLESYLVQPGMAGKYLDEWLSGKAPGKFSLPDQDRALPDKAG